MIKFGLLFLMICMTTGSSGQTPQTPAQTKTNMSIKRRDTPLRAQLYKDKIWLIKVDEEHRKYLYNAPLGQNELPVKYHLPAEIVDEFGIPAWKVRNDTVFRVVSPASAPGNIGQYLTKTRVKNLIPVSTEVPGQEARISMRQATYEILSLKPLNEASLFDTTAEHRIRAGEGPWYDFLIDEKENCKLIIVADGHLAVWEIESHDNWDPTSHEDAKNNRNLKAEPEWKITAFVPAPFSGRFVADLGNNGLTLITETGEVWQSDSQYHFQKSQGNITSLMETKGTGTEPLLIEDTDNREVWLANFPTAESDKLASPRLLRGASAKSNDRVEKVLRAIQSIAKRK